MKSLTLISSIAAAFAIATSVSGQSAQVPAPPQSESLLIHNATVHAVSDDHPTAIDAGWVRFEDGRIVSLGEGERNLGPKEVLEKRRQKKKRDAPTKSNYY